MPYEVIKPSLYVVLFLDDTRFFSKPLYMAYVSLVFFLFLKLYIEIENFTYNLSFKRFLENSGKNQRNLMKYIVI